MKSHQCCYRKREYFNVTPGNVTPRKVTPGNKNYRIGDKGYFDYFLSIAPAGNEQ